MQNKSEFSEGIESKKIKDNKNEFNEAIVKKLYFDDRRHFNLPRTAIYERLTLAQKFAGAELFRFGYQLEFIRGNGSTSIAIFIQENNIATVNYMGEIDTQPEITIR